MHQNNRQSRLSILKFYKNKEEKQTSFAENKEEYFVLCTSPLPFLPVRQQYRYTGRKLRPVASSHPSFLPVRQQYGFPQFVGVVDELRMVFVAQV